MYYNIYDNNYNSDKINGIQEKLLQNKNHGVDLIDIR